MATEWYYSQGDQKIGPVSPAELKSLADSGQLTANDLVWKEGMTEWKSAGKIKGLFTYNKAISPPAMIPPLPISDFASLSRQDIDESKPTRRSYNASKLYC